MSAELGFQFPIVSGIPDSLSCISDSKAQDSGFHKQLFSGFPCMGRERKSRISYDDYILYAIKTVWPFPAFLAHFSSIQRIARVMPVFAVVVRDAVLQTLQPIPPRLAQHWSIVGTIIVTLLGCICTWQWTIGSVSTQEAFFTFWWTISVYAYFVTIAVASVMAAFVIILRLTEAQALFTIPSDLARFISVCCTVIMPVVIIVVGDTEFHAVFAKPSRLTCLASVMRAIIMPIVVIIVRDTVHVTFGTKPPR